MEPLYCKNTGGYLAQVADFCSHYGSPHSPFTIATPSVPMDIDTFSWVRECPEDTEIRLHPSTELRRNVRSVLNRKQPSVSLLINRESGCFAELDYFPEEMCKNFIPFQSPASLAGVTFDKVNKLGSLVICLLRHRLLESRTTASLYSDTNTNRFKREEGCEFFERDGHPIVRNRYSGRAIRMNHEFQLSILSETPELEVKTGDMLALFQKLCSCGILRQILPNGSAKT